MLLKNKTAVVYGGGGPIGAAVAKAFAKIEEELRSRYAVSYKPSQFTPDGHYRTIKIEARKGGDKVQIRARKGYYARAASWLSSDPAEEVRTSALAVKP